MRQAVMVAPEEIAYREVPVPEIGPAHVLVRVARIGICGSDIHVWHGRHPYTSYPVVQGHEVSGTVAEVGAEVTGLREGELVTIRPQVVCGRCGPCRRGESHICESLRVMGFQTEGAAADYVAVDRALVVSLPEPVTLDTGALVEPLAVAARATRRAGELAGSRALVIGAGPIGNLVAQVARARGARVVIADRSAFRLEVARRCGVQEGLLAGAPHFREQLLELLGPELPDDVFECVGANETMSLAIASVRKGGDVVVVGVFPEHASLDIGRVQDAELNLRGTLMYTREDFEEAVTLLAAGAVHPGPLITHRFPFDGYAEAYRFIEGHREQALKVLITM